MQIIGFAMLGLFFSVLYARMACDWGYWMAAKIWLTAIFAAAFVVTAMLMIKAGSL